MDISNIKVVVFDLDGTLYEDTHHFDYYANCLKDKLPSEKAGEFESEYQQAKQEKHPLKIGRVYDVKQDLILVQLDNIVQQAYKWGGEPVPQSELKELYADPISMDLESMLNVGDSWWIPGSLGRHFGLTNEQAYDAFLETRTYMMGPDFQMNKIKNLKETLEEVRDRVNLVLLTNSPEPDSKAIIKKLDLQDVFHEKIFMGKKPALTFEHFKRIKDSVNVEYSEILSIGDNWINEIRPAKQLGCSTIYIDPHHLGEKEAADLTVEKVNEIIPILKSLTQSSQA